MDSIVLIKLQRALCLVIMCAIVIKSTHGQARIKCLINRMYCYLHQTVLDDKSRKIILLSPASTFRFSVKVLPQFFLWLTERISHRETDGRTDRSTGR